MRKTVVLASLMLTLLTLTALMPAVKAVTYYWDGVRFVEGQLAPGHYIQYPHPDRDYYGISPYSKWSKEGVKLYHNQLDYATSIALVLTAPVIGAAIGAIIGTRIGHPVLCGFLGLVLGTVLTWVAQVYFLDEYNCLWWWISTLFMDWLTENAWWLTIKCITNPNEALTDIMSAFLIGGYLRAGSVTFYDAVGAGNPQFSYTLTISATSGGTTEPPSGTYDDYSYGESVTVTPSPYTYYEFDCWLLDGTIMYENPITVIMYSDHTLKAYFRYSGGGGGGGSCPTLFVWNGSDYVDYGVIDIHNPTGEDVIREVSIQAEDVAINKHKAVFRLREGWEGLNSSESVIDQVKLYTVDDDDNRLCPLISAEHSRLGNVLPQLRKSDDYRVQTLLLETTDLTFIVPYQNIQSFTFVIEGCNREKTIK